MSEAAARRKPPSLGDVVGFLAFLVGLIAAWLYVTGWTYAYDDFAGRDVERGKQRRGAVALIIMGHGSGAAFLQRQARLGPVECLNLAFLVDGQHKRPLRRVEVKADDVLDLNGEVWIG